MPGSNPGSRIDNVVKVSQPTSGAIGAPSDPPATLPTDTTPFSFIALLKAFVNLFVAFTASGVSTLSAPGEEEVIDISSTYLKNHVFTFDVATIDTDVTVGIFGKAVGEGTRSQSGDNNSVITANGRFTVKIKNTPLSDVALRLVAETGGAAVTIANIEYRGMN